MIRKHKLHNLFTIIILTSGSIFYSCIHEEKTANTPESHIVKTPLPQQTAPKKREQKKITAADIHLIKNLQYTKHTLQDEYVYKDKTRRFQWDKIKEELANIENAINDEGYWAVLSNYKNLNTEAPTVKNFVRDDYGRVTDNYGVERYQSVPLYSIDNTKEVERYGRDGWVVKVEPDSSGTLKKIRGVSFEGEYWIPSRYLIEWGNTPKFGKVAVVDVTNQNIATLERKEDGWHILSMNPATSGVHRPPHAQETPTGIFAIQEKKSKMFYFKDGTNVIHGYAPFASRFSAGAHIHGIPTQDPQAPFTEYSSSLGTVPKSHKCVRNASSHAQFVYRWATVKESLVLVIK